MIHREHDCFQCFQGGIHREMIELETIRHKAKAPRGREAFTVYPTLVLDRGSIYLQAELAVRPHVPDPLIGRERGEHQDFACA